MKKIILFGSLFFALLVTPILALKPPMTPPMFAPEHILVNDMAYDTRILGDIKNPNPNSLDNLYVIVDDQGNEVPGQRPISDVAPGIPGYNGGRWAVIPVTVTEAGWAVHDPDNDGDFDIELTNLDALITHADDAGLDHFDIANTPVKYFLCPLLGKGQPIE